ncbi:MAG: antibiotic biosynthesis monooxygenase [Propionicimonas sp.]
MYILIRRVLNDFEAWKQVVTNLDGLRAQYGSRGLTAYRSASNPSEVLLVFEWDDDKPYTAYLELPEVQGALAATGTVDVTEVSEVFHLAE